MDANKVEGIHDVGGSEAGEVEEVGGTEVDTLAITDIADPTEV